MAHIGQKYQLPAVKAQADGAVVIDHAGHPGVHHLVREHGLTVGVEQRQADGIHAVRRHAAVIPLAVPFKFVGGACGLVLVQLRHIDRVVVGVAHNDLAARHHVVVGSVTELGNSDFLGLLVSVLADGIAGNGDVFADIRGGVDHLLIIGSIGQPFHARIQVHELFQTGELRQLGNKFLILHGIERILVLELGDQQQHEGIFVHIAALLLGKGAVELIVGLVKGLRNTGHDLLRVGEFRPPHAGTAWHILPFASENAQAVPKSLVAYFHQNYAGLRDS